jgi:hypothetical protein
MSNNCTVPCPYCGKDVDIIQGMELQAGNDWTPLLAELPTSLIGALFRYLELFKPPKQALRWSRRLALTEELMPMIKSGTVQRGGITYAMPMQAWEAEMMKLVSNKPASLVLPLKSNGYLLSIMVGRVEKNLAAAEAKEIEAQRNRGHVGAQNGLQPVGAVMNKKAGPQTKPKSPPPEGWQGKAKRLHHES